jgi:hypothetical protein
VRSRTALRVVVCVAVSLTLLRGGSLQATEGDSSQESAAPRAVRAIAMTSTAETVTVSIDIAGGGITPAAGFVDGPPRIFLDFPGVALQTAAVTASRDSRIRRIRAAVHSARPLVTRVVIDLAAPMPFRITTNAGRVSVVLGQPGSEGAGPPIALVSELSAAAPASAPIPPVPDLPPAPVPALASAAAPAVPAENPPAPKRPPAGAPAARPASSVARPSTSAKDTERYLRQVSPALDRLRLQEPILTALDTAEPQDPERIQLAIEEFERLRQELSGMKPADSMRAQHDMLVQSTILALMATRLRLEAFRTSDAATLRNAASAAAGATLLLDRACADLGCPDSNR